MSQADKARGYRWPMIYAMDYLNKAYHYCIEKTGGAPLGLFNTGDDTVIMKYLDMVDSVLFTGGVDVNAKRFGQKRHRTASRYSDIRDTFEIKLINGAIKRGMPIFCICRGHQVLNVALGGDLYQDTKLMPVKTIKHTTIKEGVDSHHYISIEKDSLLYDILKSKRIKVNSAHHQVVNNPGKGLVISARAADSVTEALDMPGYPFMLSVQWHPERIPQAAHTQKLFEAFVSHARKYNL